MLKHDRALKLFSLLIFFSALIFWLITLNIGADNSENSLVYKLLFSLTKEYRIRSVLANFLLYLLQMQKSILRFLWEFYCHGEYGGYCVLHLYC